MNRTAAGNEYRIHLLPFPPAVLAAVVALDDGTYDVFLNDALSLDLQRKALRHELRHIDKGHLYNDILTVEDMEKEAI